MRLPTLHHSQTNTKRERRNSSSAAPTMSQRAEKQWEVRAPHEGHTGSNVPFITGTEQVCFCIYCSTL